MRHTSSRGGVLRSILLLFLIAGFAFVAGTWWALEASGVAIVETEMVDGTMRRTHVWFAEPNGELWVEAGTPENGWYVDIQDRPALSLTKTDSDDDSRKVSGAYLAEPIPGPDAHEQIRSLLRSKYGFRDWWIGVVFDTTRSVAVRLIQSSPATSTRADDGELN